MKGQVLTCRKTGTVHWNGVILAMTDNKNIESHVFLIAFYLYQNLQGKETFEFWFEENAF